MLVRPSSKAIPIPLLLHTWKFGWHLITSSFKFNSSKSYEFFTSTLKAWGYVWAGPGTLWHRRLPAHHKCIVGHTCQQCSYGLSTLSLYLHCNWQVKGRVSIWIISPFNLSKFSGYQGKETKGDVGEETWFYSYRWECNFVNPVQVLNYWKLLIE